MRIGNQGSNLKEFLDHKWSGTKKRAEALYKNFLRALEAMSTKYLPQTTRATSKTRIISNIRNGIRRRRLSIRQRCSGFSPIVRDICWIWTCQLTGKFAQRVLQDFVFYSYLIERDDICLMVYSVRARMNIRPYPTLATWS